VRPYFSDKPRGWTNSRRVEEKKETSLEQQPKEFMNKSTRLEQFFYKEKGFLFFFVVDPTEPRNREWIL
jgi:hypothetical protein